MRAWLGASGFLLSLVFMLLCRLQEGSWTLIMNATLITGGARYVWILRQNKYHQNQGSTPGTALPAVSKLQEHADPKIKFLLWYLDFFESKNEIENWHFPLKKTIFKTTEILKEKQNSIMQNWKTPLSCPQDLRNFPGTFCIKNAKNEENWSGAFQNFKNWMREYGDRWVENAP